jgi:hypothetical protein
MKLDSSEARKRAARYFFRFAEPALLGRERGFGHVHAVPGQRLDLVDPLWGADETRTNRVAADPAARNSTAMAQANMCTAPLVVS